MHYLAMHFDNWCSAAGVDSFESLHELIILEQFKNSVPECIATYIGERGVKSVGEAAALADDYFLIHTSRGGVGPYETRANRPFKIREVVFQGTQKKFVITVISEDIGKMIVMLLSLVRSKSFLGLIL